MKKRIFTGAGTALVTPMKEDGSINYTKLESLVNSQIESGIDALIILGTTGESPTIGYHERDLVVASAVKAAGGRVPVIVGAGSNDTARSVTLANLARDCGADALLMVTPFYNKTSQNGIIRHYNYIADRVDLPMILYNVPSRTGLNIKPETYFELSKHPNICAVKEANGNMESIRITKELCGDELDIYSGNDTDIYDVLELGGIGVISVLSNILPAAVHEMCAAYFDGKSEKCRSMQEKYMPFINSLFADVNPIPVKEAMNMLGMDVGPLRLPLVPTDEKTRDLIKKEMVSLGLLK